MVKIPTFPTYRRALQHYKPVREKRASPFRVQTPPTIDDFTAHGHFTDGEATMEYIRDGKWGGSFGQSLRVWSAWRSKRETHNHPNYQRLPSWRDLSFLPTDKAVVVTSHLGLTRIRLNYFPDRFKAWPDSVQTVIFVKARSGRTISQLHSIQHSPGERAEEMLVKVFSPKKLLAARRAMAAAEFPGSFFASSIPATYSREGKLVFAEVAFIVWRDFPSLFKMFDRSAYALLDPRTSWGRFFRS